VIKETKDCVSERIFERRVIGKSFKYIVNLNPFVLIYQPVRRM